MYLNFKGLVSFLTIQDMRDYFLPLSCQLVNVSIEWPHQPQEEWERRGGPEVVDLMTSQDTSPASIGWSWRQPGL